MSEHTPGPWWIEHEDDEGQLLENGVTIESTEGPVAFKVLDCDARIIAAAPELLAALREMREQFTSDGTDGQHAASAQADAAIKKATGR
jgi:hypothetical protein